jgi:hypothetical protein
VSFQSLVLIFMVLVIAGLACLTVWATWQMWKTNMPPARAQNPDAFRRVTAGFAIFWIGSAVTALFFGWTGVLVWPACALGLLLLLNLVGLARVPARIRRSARAARARHPEG